MRASVRKDDSSYNPQHTKLEVYLDGEPVRGCITADEEKGEIVVYAKDGKGHYVMESEKLKTETRTGKVEIRRKV
jgi:hypothetical protein